MKSFSFLLATIVGLVTLSLSGCGDTVTKPQAYNAEPLPVEITENNIQMKGSDQKYLTVNIKALISPRGTTKAQRASTAIDLAYEAYEKQENASAIFVYLYDEVLPNSGTVSRVNLYPKKCGMLEDDCNNIQWDVYVSDNSPSNLEIKVTAGWWHMRDRFQKNGMTDEDALTNFIASTLKISANEVTLFNYNDYSNHETF
ncbi:DUF4875 domain-containing protein [Vibrio rumoiensis]|uniref:DUF4875 domain-containing protein n=1 Tax=Vibrio rumoiensis TaxID=76258 RepID=A0ABW7IZV0_9VIBR